MTEQHPDLHPSRVPMVFDLSAGLYWRPEEGGLLFGMSNPDEPPGENRSVDEGYLALMRERLARLVPVSGSLGLRRSGPPRSISPPTTCRSSARRSARPGRCPA